MTGLRQKFRWGYILSAFAGMGLLSSVCSASEFVDSVPKVANSAQTASLAEPIQFGDAGLIFIPKAQYLMDGRNAGVIKPMREAFLEHAKFDSLVNVGVFAQSPVLYGKQNIFLVLEQEEVTASAGQKAALLLGAASLGVIPSVSSKETGLLLSVRCPNDFKFAKTYQYNRQETASLFLLDRNHHAGLAFYRDSVKDFFAQLNADPVARENCQQSLLTDRKVPVPVKAPSGQEAQFGLYINQGPDFYRIDREQIHFDQIVKIVAQAADLPTDQIVTSQTRNRTIWLNYDTKKDLNAADAAELVAMVGTLGLIPVKSRKRPIQVSLQAFCDGQSSETYIHKGEIQEVMALYVDANRSLNKLLSTATEAFFAKLRSDPKLRQSCQL